MTTSDAQLLEKCPCSGTGILPARQINILYDRALLNVIRENALGNFRDLLMNVNKSADDPVLNNNQNKKPIPMKTLPVNSWNSLPSVEVTTLKRT
jgi:hypothetical protein